MKTVKDGRVAIITNDKIAPLFPTYKGVREGDPFSPLLFNIAADGIAWLIEKAQDYPSYHRKRLCLLAVC